MKKIILALSCLGLFAGVNAQTFTDGFESDTLGLLGPQSATWRTWSGLGGGPEDVMVVNTENHTPGGSKSIHFFSTKANGGPIDVILPFNNVPLTTGEFTFSSWFKIGTASDAYFNFQGDTTLGDTYVLDCNMAGTNLQLTTDGDEVINATIPANAWFNVTIEANFNKNSWKLLVDGTVVGTWKSAANRVFGTDFYPSNSNAEFWVDDVSFDVKPYTFPSLNAAASNMSVAGGFVGDTKSISVVVRNLGIDTIRSYDIAVSQNNGAPVKSSVTGVNIAALNSSVATLTSPIILATGVNTFTAIVSNVNGLGTADGDVSDDTATTTALGVVPALGKAVVAEEGTGTWCQWCPRGAVFMDMMAERYSDRFIGIAVHNGKKDPMVVVSYDADIKFGGFPNSLVDRATQVDPSLIENDFLKRIAIAPKGLLVNGATFDAVTRELKVSVTTTIQQDIAGDFKVSCVLTEDSVSGTDAGYKQVNAYAGGSTKMGGFELLPNPVPAALMNYNFVARALSPSFKGLSGAYGATAAKGAVFIHNFSFILPATWDLKQMKIVGLMIAPDSTIENAASATIDKAIATGYTSGVVVTGVKELAEGPDAINLMPNPASVVTTITMNLKKEATLSVDIYSANGALIASKAYGKIVGAYQLPIDIQNFAKGIYFVRVNVNNEPTLLKLIKE